MTPEELEAYLPPGLGGNILITSRNSAMQRLTSSESSYEVGEMEEDDAILLLIKAACLDTSSSELKTEASKIVKELFNMPLAVDQAGAYIASGGSNIRNYLSKYYQHRKTLLSHSEFKGASKYNRTVYGTWELSYQEIQRRAESDHLDKAKAAQSAMHILALFVFFHYDGIMKDIFSYAAMHQHCCEHSHSGLPVAISMLDCTLLPVNEAGTWDDFVFEEGLRVLLSFCLIRQGSSEGLYAVHPLIHAWGKDRMSLSERKKYCIIAYATLLSSLYGDFDMQPIEFRRALVTHVRENMKYMSIEGQNEGGNYFDDAYERFGHLLFEQGYPSEALKLQQEILDMRSKALGEEHFQTIRIAGSLARTYRNLGRYADAEKLNTHVLHVLTRLFGPEHQNTIRAMGHLTDAYLTQGKYSEAMELQTHVLNLCFRTLGEDHVDSISALARLASTLHYLGKYSEALKLEIQILAARNRTLGTEHPETIHAMTHLARTYMSCGEYSEAEKLQIQVIDLSIRIYGVEHPATTKFMSNLATLYNHLNKHLEAEDLNIQVLDTNKKILGEDHPDTVYAVVNLAVTYNLLGKYEEAEKLEIHILDVRTRALGAEHPDTLYSMSNLAWTFRGLKKYSEAEKLEIHVLDVMTQTLGAEHPGTINAMGNLAISLRALGKYSEAEKLQIQALESSKRILGEEHRETKRAIAGLATTQRLLGNNLRAEDSDKLTLQSPSDIQSTQPAENQNRKKKSFIPNC